MYRNPFQWYSYLLPLFSHHLEVWFSSLLGAKDFSYKKLFRFVSGALTGQTTPLVLELQCMNSVTALIWHTLLKALWVGDLMT